MQSTNQIKIEMNTAVRHGRLNAGRFTVGVRDYCCYSDRRTIANISAFVRALLQALARMTAVCFYSEPQVHCGVIPRRLDMHVWSER